MNIRRKQKKYVELRTLRAWERFRFRGEGGDLWQVNPTTPYPSDFVVCNNVEMGHQQNWHGGMLVKVVKGRWVPEEPEGRVEIGNVKYREIVEYNGKLWLYIRGGRCRAVSGCSLLGIFGDEEISIAMDTLVRVVNCTLVEDYQEPQDE